LAALAGAQHGVVSLAQLRKLGWSDSAVRGRVASGKLHRIHRGVYSVGHRLLTREGVFMAAVLACGTRAALSHLASAEHWQLRANVRRLIDVTCATGAGRSRSGIHAHEGKLLKRDVVVRHGIPCTTVARTLLDIAEQLDLRGLERAVDQAEVQRLLRMREVDDVLARSNGRRGASKLRAVLAIENEPALTKSEMEELFLALCIRYGLPIPLVNHYVEGEQVDFHWPEYCLIVETDSKRWHGTTRRRESDNARDRRLQLAGWRVLRFSWRAVAEEPAAVAAELRAFLTGPGVRRIAS
jgi:hypothetical protein